MFASYYCIGRHIGRIGRIACVHRTNKLSLDLALTITLITRTNCQHSTDVLFASTVGADAADAAADSVIIQTLLNHDSYLQLVRNKTIIKIIVVVGGGGYDDDNDDGDDRCCNHSCSVRIKRIIR